MLVENPTHITEAKIKRMAKQAKGRITTIYLLVVGVTMPISSYLNRRCTMKSTVIAAVILYEFGTGAVRGFALTLMIAESKTEEKDVMVKVVVNLINQQNV